MMLKTIINQKNTIQRSETTIQTYFLIPSSSFNFGLICSSIIRLISTPHAVNTVSLSPASNKAIMISSTKQANNTESKLVSRI